MKESSLKLFPIYFFIFTVPISVCTIVLPNFEYLTIFASFIMMAIFYRRQTYIDSYFRNVLLFFYAPILVSTLYTCLKLGFKNDVYYYQYVNDFIPGRIIHLVMFIFIFNYIHCYIFENKNDVNALNKLLYSYLYGIIIILGIFGIWQIVSNVTGIWCPQFETRGALYFATDLGIKRITSIADEPSYLVPFLIDGILLSMFFKKKFFSILLSIVLLASLSFGAYVEAFFLSLTYILLIPAMKKTKIIASLIGVVIMMIIIFPEILDFVVSIISSREELQSGFEMDDTSRTAMIVYPIKILFEGNFMDILLGNGPASFKYLEISDPKCLFGTSNNILVDLFYEGGLLAIVMLITLFVLIWRSFSKFKRGGADIIIIKLFLIHILLSSQYRADYASERFVVLLILVECLFLIKYESEQRKEEYQ